MSFAYEVSESVEGTTRYFYLHSDAKQHKKYLKKHLHQTFCVDKKTPNPGTCGCGKDWMNGEKCVAHSYAEKVKEHPLNECPHAGDVNISSIEIL